MPNFVLVSVIFSYILLVLLMCSCFPFLSGTITLTTLQFLSQNWTMLSSYTREKRQISFPLTLSLAHTGSKFCQQRKCPHSWPYMQSLRWRSSGTRIEHIFGKDLSYWFSRLIHLGIFFSCYKFHIHGCMWFMQISYSWL